jgi:hypothetical protein
MNWSNFKHWWTLMGAAGAAIAVASIPQTFISGFLIGGALFFFGVGEWSNHQREEKVKQKAPEGMIGFRMVTVYPWTPTVLGVIFDAIGAALFGFVIYRAIY